MKYRQKTIIIEATRWFRNGDHPKDNCRIIKPNPLSTTQFAPHKAEGEVVRYFRHPDITVGSSECKICGERMDAHGWIDVPDSGHTVCPGDYVITESNGDYHPCKADIFLDTYEAIKD